MCEGYNQRVVFKDPLNAYRPSLSNSHQIAFTGPMPGTGNMDIYSQSVLGQNPLPIAPKPFTAVNLGHVTSFSAPSQAPSSSVGHREYTFSENLLPTPDTVDRSRLPDPGSSQILQGRSQHMYGHIIKQEPKGVAPLTPPNTNSIESSDTATFKSQTFIQTHFFDHNVPEPLPNDLPYSSTVPWNTEPQTPLSSLTPIGPLFSAGLGDTPTQYTVNDHNFEQLKLKAYQDAQWTSDRKEVQEDQYIEDEEDPFDVSDDDIDMEDYGDTRQWNDQNSPQTPKNLSVLVAFQRNRSNSVVGLRSFKSYIDGMDGLTNYIPSPQSTPLRDQITARIFCHFINVSGPAISMYERHPANPSLIFQGTPVPKSQQHIWACKLYAYN
jgi:hypothetical protein